jgi:hypothetical protein
MNTRKYMILTGSTVHGALSAWWCACWHSDPDLPEIFDTAEEAEAEIRSNLESREGAGMDEGEQEWVAAVYEMPDGRYLFADDVALTLDALRAGAGRGAHA